MQGTWKRTSAGRVVSEPCAWANCKSDMLLATSLRRLLYGAKGMRCSCSTACYSPASAQSLGACKGHSPAFHGEIPGNDLEANCSLNQIPLHLLPQGFNVDAPPFTAARFQRRCARCVDGPLPSCDASHMRALCWHLAVITPLHGQPGGGRTLRELGLTLRGTRG